MIDFKHVNKVRMHNKNETMTHFLIKSAVAKHLFNKGYMIYTEHQFNNHVCDVFAFNKKNEMLIVEIETKKINKKIASFDNDYGVPHITLFVDDIELKTIEEYLDRII